MKASFIFEVTVQSYSNPNGKLVDGSDCDTVGDCDPYYETFCLRAAGHPESDTEHCSLGSNGDDVDATHGFSRAIESALPWPVSFLVPYGFGFILHVGHSVTALYRIVRSNTWLDVFLPAGHTSVPCT